MTSNKLWNADVYKNENPIPSGTEVQYPIDIKVFAVGPPSPSSAQPQNVSSKLADIVPEIFTNLNGLIGSPDSGGVSILLDCGMVENGQHTEIPSVTSYEVRITKA